MKKIFVKPVWISIIIIILTGCGLNHAQIELSTDKAYLCAQNDNYEPGIVLYSSTGEEILHLSDACMKKMTSPDGTVLDRMIGQIPSDSLLFISLDINAYSGVWDTSTQSWAIEPTEGWFLFTEQNEKILSFSIGENTYNIACEPLHTDEEFFEINGQVLVNGYDSEGKKCIYNSENELFLDEKLFIDKNKTLSVPMPDTGVEITGVVDEKYMILEAEYSSPNSTEKTHIEYLCDTNGIIQYPEWNNRNITYAENQYGETDLTYIEFKNTADTPSQFLNIDTGEGIVLPAEFENIRYAANGLFYFYSGNNVCIYDAINHIYGATFTLDDIFANIYIFGPQSYLIQSITGAKYSKFVIDGLEQLLSDNVEILLVFSGDYPVIVEGKLGGPYWRSYILDDTGSLVMTGNGNVCYADSSYYLEISNNSYSIKKYK